MTRILIVDSDELLLELLSVSLNNAGYDTAGAANGAIALSEMRREKPDLIVTEQMMPSLSGFEMLIEMRADPALSLIPVIFLSQRYTAADVKTAKALGAVDYTAKPFCPHMLRETIEHALNERKKVDLKSLKVTIFGAAMAAAAIPGAANAQTLPSVLPINFTLTDTQIGSTEVPGITLPGTEPAIPPFEEEPAETNDNAVRNHNWIAALSRTHSQISAEGRPERNWQDTMVTLVHRPSDRVALTAEVEHSKRFGLTDVFLQARADFRIGKRAGGYLGLTATPNADFKEKFGVRAGASGGVAPGVELGIDTRYGEFEDGPKLSATPTVTYTTLEERLSFTAGYINLWDIDRGERYDGWSGRVRGKPVEDFTITAGMAQYPDVETGVTRTVTSRYGALTWDASDQIAITGSYSNDDYNGAFDRTSINLSIVFRFGG